MSEVKRFGFGLDGPGFRQCSDGCYVLISDFDRVVAERDAALADVERLDNALKVIDAAAEKWLSDLTKARELFELILDDPRLVVAMPSNILFPVKSLLSVKSEPFESKVSALQQRLTAADEWAEVLAGLLRDVTGRGRVVNWELGLMDQIDDALKGFCPSCNGAGWANQGCVDLCVTCNGSGMTALKPTGGGCDGL